MIKKNSICLILLSLSLFASYNLAGQIDLDLPTNYEVCDHLSVKQMVESFPVEGGFLVITENRHSSRISYYSYDGEVENLYETDKAFKRAYFNQDGSVDLAFFGPVHEIDGDTLYGEPQATEIEIVSYANGALNSTLVSFLLHESFVNSGLSSWDLVRDVNDQWWIAGPVYHAIMPNTVVGEFIPVNVFRINVYHAKNEIYGYQRISSGLDAQLYRITKFNPDGLTILTELTFSGWLRRLEFANNSHYVFTSVPNTNDLTITRYSQDFSSVLQTWELQDDYYDLIDLQEDKIIYLTKGENFSIVSQSESELDIKYSFPVLFEQDVRIKQVNEDQFLMQANWNIGNVPSAPFLRTFKLSETNTYDRVSLSLSEAVFYKNNHPDFPLTGEFGPFSVDHYTCEVVYTNNTTESISEHSIFTSFYDWHDLSLEIASETPILPGASEMLEGRFYVNQHDNTLPRLPLLLGFRGADGKLNLSDNMEMELLQAPDIIYGIEDIATNLSVFPNPVKDKISFKIEGGLNEIFIYNIDGVLVLAAKSAEGLTSLEIEKLITGTYFLVGRSADDTLFHARFLKP